MALLPVAACVGLLILLIALGRMQPFLAFIITAFVAALTLHMPLDAITKTIEHGLGDTLGGIAATICLGAMFGKLVAQSGAAQRIAQSLIGLFGLSLLGLAMALTGLIVGIPLFYNVGFVVMVPLIFSVADRTKLPVVFVGLPLLAGLSMAHGFLPPHPSPTALVQVFGANTGLTMVYGLMVGVPSLLIAGPLFALTLKSIDPAPSPLFTPIIMPDDALPGAFNSLATALLPVVLIAATTVLSLMPGLPVAWKPAVALASQPTAVLLVSLLVAVVTLGTSRGKALGPLMESLGTALRDIGPILLIIGGAGALKQVFIDSGVSAELGITLKSLPIPPLVLGWLLATVIRICLGSATVAGLTAAGIVAPLVKATGVDPNLMVLAVGAGSLMCSHVNDSAFWMFKEYFNLSLKDTFRSWSLMETLTGLCGLGFVLILHIWV